MNSAIQSLSIFVVLLHMIRIGEIGGAEEEKKREEILHGKIVDIADHPYQVALLNTKANRIICGGVIVKPRVIFTGIQIDEIGETDLIERSFLAAHCTHTRSLDPRKNLAVLVGANHVDDDEGNVHHIAKVMKHPDFSYHGLDSDISVLLLEEPIKFGDKAQNIEISTDDHPGGTRASVSGWGRTEYGFPSRDLRAVKVELDHHDNCQRHFPGVFHPTITDNMVCIKPHHKSTYYGDSGGPLTVNGKLVGLVSFGRTLKPNKKTTVFTKVGNFVDFVDSVLPEEFKEE